ncbi:MAG: hypothetical protein V2A66_06075 [Pseudomonadota bacterium]
MKTILAILISAVFLLSFAPQVDADELNMMIWHPKIEANDIEMKKKIDIFIQYLNGKLTRDQITYTIVETPEEASKYIEESKPALGFVFQRYWTRQGHIFPSGRRWLVADHLTRPTRPPNLYVGQAPLLPDIASSVFLKGLRFKGYMEHSGDPMNIFDLMRTKPAGIMGMNLGLAPTVDYGKAVYDLMSIMHNIGAIFGLFQGKAPGIKSVVLGLSPDIPEGDKRAVEEALLHMNADPTGRDILESLYIKNFRRPSQR